MYSFYNTVDRQLAWSLAHWASENERYLSRGKIYFFQTTRQYFFKPCLCDSLVISDLVSYNLGSNGDHSFKSTSYLIVWFQNYLPDCPSTVLNSIHLLLQMWKLNEYHYCRLHLPLNALPQNMFSSDVKHLSFRCQTFKFSHPNVKFYFSILLKGKMFLINNIWERIIMPKFFHLIPQIIEGGAPFW